jgi:hypothetical protein
VAGGREERREEVGKIGRKEIRGQASYFYQSFCQFKKKRGQAKNKKIIDKEFLFW